MNHDDLECWSIRAAQWMQDVIDEAQKAAGEPDGETECLDGRELLNELDAIVASGPATGEQQDVTNPVEKEIT